ncbi:Crotonobetainyl-CoA reductase [Streptomyces antimycoticus]
MTASSVRPVSEREARQVAEAAREQVWHKPSFAKELFLGRFRLDLIHPHPAPAPDDVRRGETFLAKLREFCETRVDAARIEREAQIPDETIQGLKELGALGMKIDTKYGGLGLTQVYYNKALALAGSASPAIGALLSAHQSIGVPQPLKLFGTQEQKDRFLPRCARTDITAFLLTEPDVGSDPARLATTAVPDGDDYLLDGVKLWTTNGVVADLLVVMARVPRSEGRKGGITAFVVETASEGVTVEKRNAFMGLRGLENGVTRFHRVRVPAANRIGPEGAGLKIALTTLNTGRLSLPAMCAGAGKWCLKVAREWSAAREQWGKPIAEHEAVGAKISFIAATTFALEAVIDLASQMADEDRNDIRIEAALAKLYGSEMGWLMADELVQIRGGRGYRNRGLAGRPRGARRPRRADAPRSAHQPDLRGLDGDHAYPHRPRGRGRPSVGGGRSHRPRQVLAGQGQGGRQGRWLLRPLAARPARRSRPTAPLLPGVPPGRASGPVTASALCGALGAQAGPLDVLRHVPLAGPDGDQTGLPRPDRGHRRGAVRDERGLRTGRDAALAR